MQVTTPMLWVKGEVTPLPLIRAVLLPSIMCAATAVGITAAQFTLQGSTSFAASAGDKTQTPRGSNLVFVTGVAGLLAVRCERGWDNGGCWQRLWRQTRVAGMRREEGRRRE